MVNSNSSIITRAAGLKVPSGHAKGDTVGEGGGCAAAAALETIHTYVLLLHTAVNVKGMLGTTSAVCCSLHASAEALGAVVLSWQSAAQVTGY